MKKVKSLSVFPVPGFCLSVTALAAEEVTRGGNLG